MWNPAFPSNFQTKVLPGRQYQFHHPNHGLLTITRHPKGAGSTQVRFDLRLTTPAGNVINDVCSGYVVNNDPLVFQAPLMGLRGAPQPAPQGGGATIGYGDIDISSMGGMRIIYLAHFAMASAGRELGVPNFSVDNVVNPALNHICRNCDMRYSNDPSGWQGVCSAVASAAIQQANAYGWH